VKLYNEVPDVPALLFKKIENLPEEKETPSVEKVKIENVIPQVPSIKTLEERQIIQMNINDKKIRYMEAQNCILEEYIRQAVKHLNTDDLAPAYQAFLKKYPQSPNLETLNKEALVSFLDTMPCSFNEINFLFTILKENGSRRKM
jgi:predicted ATPase with chaperone activity